VSAPPTLDVERVSLRAILGMREEYRRELNCQIVHDSWHERGFTQSYVLRVHGEVVGYAAVGGAPGDTRDIVKEFYVRVPYRGAALPLFGQLVAVSSARRVEAQTNDTLLLLMLYDCAMDISSDTILFADRLTTTLPPPGVTLRRLSDADRGGVFTHTVEPVGDWGLELAGAIVATGGLLYHYNPRYGDIYMEVAPDFRRRGFGSYLVQELKRECYELGCTPGARCGEDNVGSRRTLQRAGMFPCARVLRGRLRVNGS
jgi:GNAT superfamily N-acetyltransferase